jgi:hypothetical protein
MFTATRRVNFGFRAILERAFFFMVDAGYGFVGRRQKEKSDCEPFHRTALWIFGGRSWPHKLGGLGSSEGLGEAAFAQGGSGRL